MLYTVCSPIASPRTGDAWAESRAQPRARRRQRRRATWWVALACLALGLLPQSASAQVLPLLVDGTDADAFWWAGEDAGACVETLLDSAPRVQSLRDARRGPAISRIYQRPDITPANAANLASLHGVDSVVLGRVVRRGDIRAAWTGLERAEVALEVAWIEGTSGALRAEEYRVEVAHDADAARALERACSALGRELNALLAAGPRAPSAEETVWPAADVVVHTDGRAAPYVGFRGALRDAHPGIVDVAERWSSEGRIGVVLLLDEGYRRAEALTRVADLSGLDLGSGRVDRAEAVGDAVHVWLSEGALGDGDGR